jgi:murein DD-endopeptidase MepM/ murein hydrolase activator NlpD
VPVLIRAALSLPLLLLVSGSSEDQVLHQTLDLRVGEAVDADLAGRKFRVRLVDVQETVDEVNGAVRAAQIRVEVNGEATTLPSGNYHLPRTVAGVQVDCPITKGYLVKARKNVWGLLKDARIRLWPAGSPWIPPGTFVYPAKQRWFASYTHMANEPVFVDGGDLPAKKDIYYHYGLDIGGAEGLVDVVAATDGTVVSSGLEVLSGHETDTPVAKRYDVIYLLDGRGWYYRYSHLKFIEDWVRPGAKVAMGRKLGVLGKEGGSGGWSHLHFDITRRQPSGEWGIEEGYAFLWQAYQRERPQKLVAVARPHHLIWAGQKITLDGSRSVGGNIRHEWTFTEGGSAAGERVERTYEKPGTYCETLKVTDEAGNVEYDFAAVQVIDKSRPDKPPPTIHATYAPTFGIRIGDPVTFKVRTFRDTGGETWDFGDGTAPLTVKSDGNAVMHAAAGYAETIHRFEKKGQYLVKVEHVGAEGVRAVARLHVRVGME